MRGWALFMLGGLSLVAAPSPAGAHAAYESSDPADGATVSSPPDRIIADFTEPLAPGSTMDVIDPCGVPVDNDDPFIASDRLTVTMAGAAQGTYSVSWSAISSIDGHHTTGSFSFASSGGEACPGAEPEPEEPEEVAEPEQPSSPSIGGSSADGQGGGSSASATGSAGGDRVLAAGGARKDERGERGKANARSDGGERGSRGRDKAASRRAIPVAVAGERTSRPGEFSLGALFLALGISALIGAAGGKIYAGIMGPYT